MNENDLYERGLDVRRDILGAEYVDSGLAEADDFMTTFQHAVTELAWGLCVEPTGARSENAPHLDSGHPRRARSSSRVRDLYKRCDPKWRDRR